MRLSALVLLATLSLAPALVGCSGFQPFWKSDSDAKQAARRSVEGPLTLARLAEQRGKTLDAERLYKSILEKDPGNPTVYHRLAIIQSKKGRFEDANAYFDKALQLKPDDPTLICDAGYCQYLQQRTEMAEALFRQALDIDPSHEAATNNLALVLGEKGDDRNAFALFRQVGTEAKAHVNMGFVYSRRGELQKAKDSYSRALSIDPRMIAAAEALVQLAQFERDTKSAVAQSKRSSAAWAEYNAGGHSQPAYADSEVIVANSYDAAPAGFSDGVPSQPTYADPEVVVVHRADAAPAEYNVAVDSQPTYADPEPAVIDRSNFAAWAEHNAGVDSRHAYAEPEEAISNSAAAPWPEYVPAAEVQFEGTGSGFASLPESGRAEPAPWESSRAPMPAPLPDWSPTYQNNVSAAPRPEGAGFGWHVGEGRTVQRTTYDGTPAAAGY